MRKDSKLGNLRKHAWKSGNHHVKQELWYATCVQETQRWFFKSGRTVTSELGQVYLGVLWRFGWRFTQLPVRLLLTPWFLGICCSRRFLAGLAQTLPANWKIDAAEERRRLAMAPALETTGDHD